LLARWLAFAFVALQEARHEEFLCQRGELRAARFTVADDNGRVVEIDDFDHGPGLRGVVTNLITLGSGHGVRAGEAHQRVAVGTSDERRVGKERPSKGR
jgi:hypothetical protein